MKRKAKNLQQTKKGEAPISLKQKLIGQQKKMQEFGLQPSLTVAGAATEAMETNFHIGEAALAKAAYGKYMVIGKGKYYNDYGLSIDRILLKLPTRLKYINTDVTKGELLATYSVEIEERHNGMVFDIAALTHAENIIPVSAVCFFGSQTVIGKTEVCFTVKLELNSDFVSFVGGKNPFVEFLLGNGYNISGYTVAFGKLKHPLAPLNRDISDIYGSEIYPAVTFSNTGIEFKVLSTNFPLDEALICVDHKPVLRILPYLHSSITYTGTGNGWLSGIVECSKPGTYEVFSVSQNNTQLTDFKVINMHQKAAKSDNMFTFKAMPTAKLLSDPKNEYLGIVSDTEITVIRPSVTSGMKMVFHANIDGGYTSIGVGGSVINSGENYTDVYILSGEDTEYKKTRFNIGKGEKTVAIIEGGSVHFGKIVKGEYIRYQLNLATGAITTITRRTADSTAIIFRDKEYMCFCQDNGQAESARLSGVSADRTALLVSYSSDFGKLEIKDGGDGYFLFSAGGINWLAFTAYFEGADVKIAQNSRVRENVYITETATNYLFVVTDFYHALAVEAKLGKEKPVVDARLVDDYIVALFADGTMTSIYLNSKKQAISCKDFVAKPVTYIAKCHEEYLAGKSFSFTTKLNFVRSTSHC